MDGRYLRGHGLDNTIISWPLLKCIVDLYRTYQAKPAPACPGLFAECQYICFLQPLASRHETKFNMKFEKAPIQRVLKLYRREYHKEIP